MVGILDVLDVFRAIVCRGEGGDVRGNRRTTRKTARAKGKRLEALAKEWLEAQGLHVELAPSQAVWVPDTKAKPGWVKGKPVYPVRPISVRSDFFGIWDGLACNGFERYLFQVTVWDGVPERRKKIQVSSFPMLMHDRILAYYGEGTRSRHFRVLRAPDFEWKGECVMPPKQEVKI